MMRSRPSAPKRRPAAGAVALAAVTTLLAAGPVTSAAAQAATETAASRAADEAPLFHTFSIAAVDPFTGEVGVAVTTRVPCVGNIVPHVRAGVGAVATQARSRIEYGSEVLDFLEAGLSPREAFTAIRR